MKLFDVYPLFDIEIVKGKGCHVWDTNGTEYLDLREGHQRAGQQAGLLLQLGD